jgi:hypothetical protein
MGEKKKRDFGRLNLKKSTVSKPDASDEVDVEEVVKVANKVINESTEDLRNVEEKKPAENTTPVKKTTRSKTSKPESLPALSTDINDLKKGLSDLVDINTGLTQKVSDQNEKISDLHAMYVNIHQTVVDQKMRLFDPGLLSNPEFRNKFADFINSTPVEGHTNQKSVLNQQHSYNRECRINPVLDLLVMFLIKNQKGELIPK